MGLAGCAPATPAQPGGGRTATAPAKSPAPSTRSAAAAGGPGTGSGDPVARAARTVRALSAALPAHSVSVAALNSTTGAGFGEGEISGMWSGSVYKLLVLEALLLQRRDEGGWLSADEAELATAAIETSDNPAGYQLFLAVGGSDALATAARPDARTRR